MTTVVRRALIWAMRLVELIILIAVLAAIGLLLFFDPNKYKATMLDELSQVTGRQVRMSGDLSLRLFPVFEVQAQGFEISNPAGFEGDFVRVERLAARISLESLMQAKTKLGGLEIHGAQLLLTRNATGTDNWSDIISQIQMHKLPPLTELITTAVAGLSGLSMGGHVSNSSVIWDDRMTNHKVVISALALTVDKFRLGQPFDVHVAADVSSDGRLKSNISISASPLVRSDPIQVELGLVKMHLRALTGFVPAGIDADLSSGVIINQKLKVLHLQDLQVTTAGLKVSGFVDIEGGKDFAARGNLAFAHFNPRNVAKSLGLRLPSTRDANVLQSAQGEGAFVASRQKLLLPKINVHLDDSKLHGSLEIENFSAPTIKGQLYCDTLNADSYLSVAPAVGTAQNAMAKQADKSEATRIGLDVDGSISINQFVCHDLHAQNVSVAARIKDNLLVVKEVKANLYGGQVQASGSLDINTSRVNLVHSLSGVQLLPLQQDLRMPVLITGRAESSGKCVWMGRTQNEIMQSLSGEDRFFVREGTIRGIDIHQRLRNAANKLMAEGDLVPSETTEFQELSGSVVLNQGLGSSKDLLLRTSFVRLTASGQVHLARKTLNGNAWLYVNKSAMTDQNGLALFAGLTIPIKVGGTFSHPEVSPDISSVLQQKSKKIVNDVINSVHPSRWLNMILP